MNPTIWVALGGLTSTTVTALGVPFIQGRIAARNAAAGKLNEERLAVYVDAMSYTHDVQTRVEHLTESPEYRSSRRDVENIPHEDLISARLRLVAPREVVEPWIELLAAWRALGWNLNEEGPLAHDEFYADPTREDVTRVAEAIAGVAQSLRRAMGVPD